MDGCPDELLSEKQRSFRKNAQCRWNIKTGATRSGKTFLDYYLIPRRVRAAPVGRHVVLLGVTKSTLERNLLEPMRQLYGPGMVGRTAQDGRMKLFGREAWALGAGRSDVTDRLRGMGVGYAYGDEMTAWSREAFEMLKSRLDHPQSCFDGTCNPAHPRHWLRTFLDSGADVFCQDYVLDDNPYLDAGFVAALKAEYAGTVYYDRYILGRWARAEGAIYRLFADAPARFLTDTPRCDFIQVGVDFGGSKSAFAFVACGLCRDYGALTALASVRHPAEGMTPDDMTAKLVAFLKFVGGRYGPVAAIYADSAEQTLINGLRATLEVPVRNSLKRPIMDRVRALCTLMGQGRFFLTEDCASLREALGGAVYNPKSLADTRLDDGSTDIDTLDAFEYAWERYMEGMVRRRPALEEDACRPDGDFCAQK